MRSVGLCIVYKNCNYGSILQSYATLLKLRSLGYDCEIIRYSPVKDALFYFKAIPRLANKDMVYGKVRTLKKKIGRILHKEYAKNDDIRARKFKGFIEENFGPFSKELRTYDELKQFASKYTDVLVGSDQLWLPSGLATNFYNLMFAPEKTNKIAYSASFGVSQIPAYQRERTKKYLERINHLSVREQAGARIIKELIGEDAAVILDPTMIIDRSVWDTNIRDEEVVKGEYIFCYFLGDNPEQRDEVRKLAKHSGLPVIVLRHLDEYIASDEQFGDSALYDIGPKEFVNLIRHAKYVCTDSFHGSVFSIIYEKQFISFNRYVKAKNSRNSRLDTLFSNIGIERRFHGDLVNEIMEPIDYNSVNKKLSIMRNQAEDFIQDAFSAED